MQSDQNKVYFGESNRSLQIVLGNCLAMFGGLSKLLYILFYKHL